MTSTRLSGHIDTGEFVRLYVMDCPNCSIAFGITTDLEKRRRKDGGSLYCPNGHSMSWPKGKSDEQKLADAAARETALQDQLSAAIQEGEATRAKLVRDRARIAAGVCPCCNRSFENVRRHMVSKHPDFAVEQVPVAPKFRCSCGRSFTTYQGLRVHQGWSRGDDWASPKTPEHWRHLTKT